MMYSMDDIIFISGHDIILISGHDQGMTDGRNKRWISERLIGMSNRCRCAKMKVLIFRIRLLVY